MRKTTTADLPIRIMGGDRGTRTVTITPLLKVIDAYNDEYVRVTLERIDDDEDGYTEGSDGE